jgi:hypothetical protein
VGVHCCVIVKRKLYITIYEEGFLISIAKRPWSRPADEVARDGTNHFILRHSELEKKKNKKGGRKNVS